MLYKAMDAIHRSAGCKVLYCDTDSVLFAGPDAFEAPFSTGEVLGIHKSQRFLAMCSTATNAFFFLAFAGDLKDEILGDYGPDAWISHFVCSGAKSYSYIVRTPKGEKSVMKLKGEIRRFTYYRSCYKNQFPRFQVSDWTITLDNSCRRILWCVW